MTSITLTVTGAKARASVTGPLTSGMVGIPVTIEYDSSWNGLTKNLVCRCGKWSPEKGETRTILNIGESATVAHEVLKPDMNLYLGIEGYSTNGKMVMPTTWADCGLICLGATINEDPSANPEFPIWAQLQRDIKQIKKEAVTEDQIIALDNLVRVCAFTKADVSAEYNAFKNVFGIGGGEEPDVPDVPDVPDEPDVPEKTLTSISVVYSGGSVAAGTAVNDLTGIVVTVHYSDGTSAAVTGYTLSGTIAEGSNIVTVTYEGKTATFAVAGVAESGGDEPETGVSNEVTWTDGVAYIYTPVENEMLDTAGSIIDYNGWSRTPYLYCEGAAKLRSECVKESVSIVGGGGLYSAFYDADKNYISSFNPSAYGNALAAFIDIEAPAAAVYFIFSHKNNVMGLGHSHGPYLKLTPHA